MRFRGQTLTLTGMSGSFDPPPPSRNGGTWEGGLGHSPGVGNGWRWGPIGMGRLEASRECTILSAAVSTFFEPSQCGAEGGIDRNAPKFSKGGGGRDGGIAFGAFRPPSVQPYGGSGNPHAAKCISFARLCCLLDAHGQPALAAWGLLRISTLGHEEDSCKL